MATTIQEPIITAPHSSSGNGGGPRFPSSTNGLRTFEKFSPAPSSTAVWVGIAAITMSFMAFTSALVVRKGGAPDWQHLTLPPILYVNTALLLISSFTLQTARKRMAAFMNGARTENPGLWLYATFGLGLLFVAGQYVAWLQLRGQGLYLATTPNSSFFYLFTVIHALHVLGGLLGLGYVIALFRKGTLRRSTLNAASHYWHFMGVLWVYLLYVLASKI